MKTLREEIQELWSELCISVDVDSNTFEQAILQGTTLLSDSVITAMEAKRAALLNEKEERCEELKVFAYKITALWDKLKVSPQEREYFFSINTGLGYSVLEAVIQYIRIEYMNRIEDGIDKDNIFDLVITCFLLYYPTLPLSAKTNYNVWRIS